MPTVEPGKKILVTGASGFIAAWVVKTLLEQGYYVRGTVRSKAKGEYLISLFKDHADRFDYVIVEDIAKTGAFDEAVKGMDAVEHTASPFYFKIDGPDELIIPAVNGTVGILDSVLQYGPTVQRVVITSSMAAILQFQPTTETQQTLTEKYWNEFSVKEVASKGKDAPAPHIYRASKTLAEKAAWDFVEKHKDIKWDIAVLNPPLVWGPTIHEIPTASSLNTSLLDVYALVKGKMPPSSAPVGNWVDVRDLATAHVSALRTENAGGERFIIASGPFTWQDILDGIHSGSEDPGLSSLPKGTPGAGKSATHPVLLDTTKARTILDINFRGLDETAKDSARSLLEREKALGW